MPFDNMIVYYDFIEFVTPYTAPIYSPEYLLPNYVFHSDSQDTAVGTSSARLLTHHCRVTYFYSFFSFASIEIYIPTYLPVIIFLNNSNIIIYLHRSGRCAEDDVRRYYTCPHILLYTYYDKCL